MKAKNVFLWLCVLALLGGLLFLYASNRQKDAELTALREEKQQAEKLRAELEQAKTSAVEAQNEEIARLRKDNQELFRLRNEIRQVREEKQQLTQQARTAQVEVQRAQAQAQAARSEVQALRTNVPPPAPVLTPEQQAAAARYGQMQAFACINNLRQLDGAKQQWALENKKTADAIPTARDLAAYLKDGVLPACPGGGAYTLNAVGTNPTCSISAHALPQ